MKVGQRCGYKRGHGGNCKEPRKGLHRVHRVSRVLLTLDLDNLFPQLQEKGISVALCCLVYDNLF